MTMEELTEMICTPREREEVRPILECITREGPQALYERYGDLLRDMHEGLASPEECRIWIPDAGAFLGYYLIHTGEALEICGGAEADDRELLDFINRRLLAVDENARQLTPLEAYGFLNDPERADPPKVDCLWNLMRFLRNMNWLLSENGYRTVLFDMGDSRCALCVCAKDDAVEIEAGGVVEDEFWKPIVPEEMKDEVLLKGNLKFA